MKYELPKELGAPVENCYLSFGCDGCQLVLTDTPNPVGNIFIAINRISLPKWMWGFVRKEANLRVAYELGQVEYPLTQVLQNISKAIKEVEAKP